jgi:hypothetical protein
MSVRNEIPGERVEIHEPKTGTKRRKRKRDDAGNGANTNNGTTSKSAFPETEDDFAAATTDSALARAFAARHKDDLRYVAFWGRWMSFAKDHWSTDETKHALDLVHDHCRETAREHAAKITAAIMANVRRDPLKPTIVTKDVEKAAMALAAKKVAHLEAAKKVNAVHTLAQADRRLAAASKLWDASPDMINEGGY